ncbi:hypothetical protein BJ912DRAFT_940457, partial [Pholiota molesta]
RVTMKTRVAIRDKSPHRFQVVPLRDVSKLETSSARLSENTTRLYGYSTLNRTALQPPSKRLGTLDQARQSPSSSSLGRCVEILFEENPGHSDRIELGLGLDEISKGSSLASSRANAILKSGSHTSLSSVVQPQIQVLSDLDMNVLERRRAPLGKISNDQIVPSMPSLSSNESIIQLINSESPLTHTISRSLQVRTRHERNHPKFSSLSNFQPPEVSQLISTSRSSNRRVRTKSDANISSRFRDSLGFNTDDSYYALLDAYDAVDPKAKKRHAIYTPTLYVPSFDQPCQFQENMDTRLDHTNWQSVHTEFESSYGAPHEVNLKVDGTSHFGSRTNLHHKTSERDINVEDDDSQALQYSPKDRSETGTSGQMDCLSFTTREHRLTHKSSSHSLRLRFPDELKLPKTHQKQRRPIIPDPPLPSEIVYPRIVLNLLADIDKAITDWNCAL